jgi:hypothetical protein
MPYIAALLFHEGGSRAEDEDDDDDEEEDEDELLADPALRSCREYSAMSPSSDSVIL